MDISLRLYSRADGSLHPVLLRGGLPLVLPNLWADQLALTRRPNSVRAYLSDVLRLYRWAAVAGVDIYDSFTSQTGLRPSQLQSLVTFTSSRSDGSDFAQSTISRQANSICMFLQFVFDYRLSHQDLSLEQLRKAERWQKTVISRLAKLFAVRAQRGAIAQNALGLTKEELEELDGILLPGSEQNPAKDEALQLRNYCIWRLMLATGARRSETVLLEIDDLQLGAKPTITFKRPTKNAANRRRDGASLKTQQRTLPIPARLARLLSDYLERARPRYVQARRPSPAVFLSARDGRRLAATTINKMLAAASVRATKNGLHPHRLRTTAMNALCDMVRDARGRLPDGFQDQLIYFAGWSASSKMPLLYTRESISAALGRLLMSASE